MPERNEIRIETGGQLSLCHRSIETDAPLLQCFGIMQTIIDLTMPGEAPRLGQRTEAAFREQHTAREDIALDEILSARILIENVILDTDILQRRPSARFQAASNAIQISGPIFLPHRLHHFDAGNGIILVVHIAIVSEADLPIPLVRQPLLGEANLLGREADAMIDNVGTCQRYLCKTAPAAANLQQPVTRFERQPVKDKVDLASLCCLQ
ncbi:MAG: hypothetical protein RIS00_1965 [Pseudomonadota bacterium]